MVYIPFNQSTLSTGTFPGASVKVFDIPRLLRDVFGTDTCCVHFFSKNKLISE